MANVMEFPDTVEEFMGLYRVTDTDHVYSNGIDYVPIFRMKQWFEHLQPKTNGDRIRSMTDEELAILLTDVAKKSAEKLCESLKTVDVDLSSCDFDILYKAHLDWLKQECE